MAKISIIVPVYKVELYLRRCVDSILNQTFTDFECILVDDGSPDKCPDICDEYARKDERIKVIHKENGGLSDARNAGLDIAQGQYIGFVDSDDWIHPQMYEILYTLAQKNNADIVTSQYNVVKNEESYTIKNINEIVNRSNTINSEEIISHYFTQYLRMVWVSVWSKLYKREVFEHIRFEKGRMYEDVIIFAPLILAAHKICITDEPLYYYFDGSESITRSNFNIKKFDILYATKNRCQYFKDYKIEYDEGMSVWYYCYTEFAIFTSLYAKKYRKVFRPFRVEMIKSISDFINNKSLCRLYKVTLLLTFISPRLSEHICKKYFQNVILTVNGFRRSLDDISGEVNI